MNQTLELELTYRWLVVVTSIEWAVRYVVVDTDQELADLLVKLAAAPDVATFRCERQYDFASPIETVPDGAGDSRAETVPVTDAEIVDDIRRAVEEVFVRVGAMRVEIGWPYMEFERRADAAERHARATVSRLGTDASPATLIAAVEPLLRECWPQTRTPITGAAAAAVERLRVAVREVHWRAA